MVNDYMRKLDQALAGLSPDVAKDVSAQVSEHIAAALSAIPNPSRSDVKKVLAEVGAPLSIAKAAAAEFPQTHRVSLRTLSYWAYVFWFGSLWWFNPRSPDFMDSGMFLVLLVTMCTGSTLIFLKNRRIANPRLRRRINLADLAIGWVALTVDWFLPVSIGMLKGPLLLALFAAYFYRTWSLYQAG